MERQVTGNTGAAGEILPAAGEDLQGIRAESLLTAAKDISIEYAKSNRGHGNRPDQPEAEWNHGDGIDQHNQQSESENRKPALGNRFSRRFQRFPDPHFFVDYQWNGQHIGNGKINAWKDQ